LGGLSSRRLLGSRAYGKECISRYRVMKADRGTTPRSAGTSISTTGTAHDRGVFLPSLTGNDMMRAFRNPVRSVQGTWAAVTIRSATRARDDQQSSMESRIPGFTVHTGTDGLNTRHAYRTMVQVTTASRRRSIHADSQLLFANVRHRSVVRCLQTATRLRIPAAPL